MRSLPSGDQAGGFCSSRGESLPDLLRVFPRIELFDRVVAENGALLFEPATKKETLLAPEPSPELVETLRKKGVNPLSVGRSIIATWEPNENLVLDAIREQGGNEAKNSSSLLRLGDNNPPRRAVVQMLEISARKRSGA